MAGKSVRPRSPAARSARSSSSVRTRRRLRPPMPRSAELQAAIAAARRAGALQLRALHEGIAVAIKADGTPVTETDIASEQIIKEILCSALPTAGFLGEEGSNVQSSANERWIVDPLDGTAKFIRKQPFFG